MSTFRELEDFGVVADPEIDQSAEIQAAIDQVSDEGGGTLWYGPGVYRQKHVYLKPGVTIRGQGTGTIVKKPDANGEPAEVTKWWRVFSCRNYDFPNEAAHDAGIGVHDMIIDGNKEGMDWDGTYSQEQAHCVFLYGNDALANRLVAKVSGVLCKNNVADGLNCYSNVDLTASDIHARDCFRGGFVATGGNSELNVINLSVDDSGIDLEPNSSTQQSNFNCTNITCGGDFDVAARGRTSIQLTNVNMTGPNWNLYADGRASITVNGGRLIAGAADGSKNRLNYPGRVTFNGTEFLVQYDPDEPDRNYSCVNIYTHKESANEVPDRCQFNNCGFGISGDFPEDYAGVIYPVMIQASTFESDNWIIVNGGYAEDARFDVGIFANRGPKVQVGNGFRNGAKRAWHFNHDANYQGHFIVEDVIYTDTCEEYAYVGNPQTGDTAIFEHRDTRVPERLNIISTYEDRQPPDSWFRGRRIIEGANDPTLVPTSGLKGDIYRTTALAEGNVYEWVCTSSAIGAATWKLLLTIT
ncbi:MAG: hypothetical protein GY952_06710 [Rhodobacteraceae bacterium]|nr:hypothetical protein [Paracoccaceae bacterium]